MEYTAYRYVDASVSTRIGDDTEGWVTAKRLMSLLPTKFLFTTTFTANDELLELRMRVIPNFSVITQTGFHNCTLSAGWQFQLSRTPAPYCRRDLAAFRRTEEVQSL